MSLGKLEVSILISLHQSFYSNSNFIQRYLAVDFQLFLITPLLVYPLWRWRKKFFWFLPTIVVLIMGCTFATMYVNNISVYMDERWELIKFCFTFFLSQSFNTDLNMKGIGTFGSASFTFVLIFGLELGWSGSCLVMSCTNDVERKSK